MVIRPAIPGEANRLSALAVRSKAHWGYPQEFMDACKDELTITGKDIQSDRSRYFVAEADSTCLGFCALTRISYRDIELEALFVEPAFIGNGYGRALIDHAKRHAASWGASRLIIQSDPHAEEFYRNAGGVRIGRRRSGSVRGRTLPLLAIDLSSADTL